MEKPKHVKLETCHDNRDILYRLSASLKNIKMYLLHPQHDSLLFLSEISTSVFTFVSYVDHDTLHLELGNTIIYDMTNYPNTISPNSGKIVESKPQEIIGIEFNNNHTTKQGNECISDMISFQNHCPERPLSPENYSVSLNMKIGSIRINYMHEV